MLQSVMPPIVFPTSSDQITRPADQPAFMGESDRDPLDGATANPIILEAGQTIEPLVAETFQFDGVQNGKEIGENALIAAATFLRVTVRYRDVYQMDRETVYFARIWGISATRVRKEIHDRVNRQT